MPEVLANPAVLANSASADGAPPWINPLTILIATIAVITIIVKLAMWAEKVNQARTDFDDHKKTLGEFMSEIRDDIKNILTRLPPVAVVGGSPLRLTDLGRSISDTLKAAEWAARIAGDVKDRIDGKQPYETRPLCGRPENSLREFSRQRGVADCQATNGVFVPWKIQEICFEYVTNEFQPTVEQEAQMKACAYENGVETKQVFDVIAVELRDRLLRMIEARESTA